MAKDITTHVRVQMTREDEDVDPVDLPFDVEYDDGTIWIYVDKKDAKKAVDTV